MESQFHVVVFVFNIIIDTRVNSDWAETIIVRFVLTIINSFGNCVRDHVHKREIYPGNVETIKIYPCFRSDAIRRSSNNKELIQTKINTGRS